MSLVSPDKMISKELKAAYDALIARYNTTQNLAVDKERRSLLSALSKLENEIYQSHFDAEEKREGYQQKTKDDVKSSDEIIEALLIKIKTMSETIFNIIEILPSDTPLYRLAINSDYYYLYKKKDGLYYEIKRHDNVVGEQIKIMTLKKNKDTYMTTLEVLQKFIIQKIEELEVEIKKYMNEDYIMAYIEGEKYTDKLLPEYMVIYTQFLREFDNGIGSKNIYYYLYYNKNTGELSYKIYGYDSPVGFATNPLNTLDGLSEVGLIDTLNVLYEFRKKLINIQNPATRTSIFRKIFAPLVFRTGAKVAPSQFGGKKASSAYKLNGEKVSLLINKKKLHRSVYVKGNGNGKAKYCKINNEFVLLSKLKNKII